MVCSLSVSLSLSIDVTTVCAYCYCSSPYIPTTLPSSTTFIYCSHRLGMLTAGLAGLSISFALAVTQSLNWTVRMASDMEGQMVSVGKQVREEGRKDTNDDDDDDDDDA